MKNGRFSACSVPSIEKSHGFVYHCFVVVVVVCLANGRFSYYFSIFFVVAFIVVVVFELLKCKLNGRWIFNVKLNGRELKNGKHDCYIC